MKNPDEKLIPCPYLVIRKRKNQDLEEMLDAWKKEALWEKRTFSTKAKKEKRANLKRRGLLKS